MSQVEINADAMRSVLAHLPPSGINACRAACSAWHKLGSEDFLWRALAHRHFWASADDAPAEPIAPEPAQPSEAGGAPVGSALAPFTAPSSGTRIEASWWHAFWRWSQLARIADADGAMDAALWLQVARAWATIERWLAAHLPEIGATLRPPASASVLRATASRPLRYMRSVHDGQDIPLDRCIATRDQQGVRAHIGGLWLGLFGGYSGYSHVVCSRMHPHALAVELQSQHPPGMFSREEGAPPAPDGPHGLELLATSFRQDRSFAADAEGGVWVARAGTWERAGPSLAGWFAHYAASLEAGTFRADLLKPDEHESRGISLFPAVVDGARCTRAVTNGIEVLASSLFMPEHPQAFAYSIRLRMLGDADAEGADAHSAQLHSRHWTVRDGADPPRTVRGLGVIGKFPVLRPGLRYRDDEQVDSHERVGFARAVPPGREKSGWFIYQSFSGPMTSAEGGTFGGELEFVPGTVAEPRGEPFRVQVAPFELKRGEYVY